MDNKMKNIRQYLLLTFDGVIEKIGIVFSVYSDGGPLALEVVLKTKSNLIL
jgi:hypothetical protein